jgi:hypothetical protein
MINKKSTGSCALAVSLVVGLGGGSPLLAKSANRPAQVEVAAVGAAAAQNPLPVPPKRYCIAESINSRIPERFCKTARGWSDVGVDLDEKR